MHLFQLSATIQYDSRGQLFIYFQPLRITMDRSFLTASSAAIRGITIAGLLFVGVVAAADNDNNDNDNGFYTKYSKYPEYCSTPSMMQSRIIPSLRDDSRSKVGETRLLHVTTVIRHGARTPVSGGSQCWDTYWEDEATGVWDCNLTMSMAPPSIEQFLEQGHRPDQQQQQQQSDNSKIDNPSIVTLFEKRYDALMDKEDGLSNHLFGTCETGQLLLQGYEQHVKNGKLLRDAYAYDSTNYDHEITMRLLDLTIQDNRPWDEPQVYLRADDEQRTLMSGEILMRSLFEPEIQAAAHKSNAPISILVHTADYDRDVLSINERICPRLTELRQSFEKSSTYKSFNYSREAKELRKFMSNDLGSPIEINIVDCLMTTVCTDRPLPGAFDYEGTSTFDLEENGMFNRMVTFAYKRFNMHLLANNGEYAKLATAPLWTEIMGNINPIIQEVDRIPPEKMAIISGHDDTISPIMASLGIYEESMWPAYASMFIIELHEIIDAAETGRSVFKSNFAFRLLFNGEVMTGKMESCQDDLELCDITVLTDLVSSFAKPDRNCKTKRSFIAALTGGSNNRMSSVWMSFLWVLLGGAFGGAGMFYYLTGSLPLPCFPNRRVVGGGSYNARESGLSIPPKNSYSDGPERYQDDPNKNGTTFLD